MKLLPQKNEVSVIFPFVEAEPSTRKYELKVTTWKWGQLSWVSEVKFLQHSRGSATVYVDLSQALSDKLQDHLPDLRSK